MRREQGQHPHEDGFGLWLRQADGCGLVHEALWASRTILTPSNRFRNIITSERRPNPGPACRGGLLADEMGLGKTLSMIALIASDHSHVGRYQNPFVTGRPRREPCSTLVVMPKSSKQFLDQVPAGWTN